MQVLIRSFLHWQHLNQHSLFLSESKYSFHRWPRQTASIIDYSFQPPKSLFHCLITNRERFAKPSIIVERFLLGLITSCIKMKSRREWRVRSSLLNMTSFNPYSCSLCYDCTHPPCTHMRHIENPNWNTIPNAQITSASVKSPVIQRLDRPLWHLTRRAHALAVEHRCYAVK